MRVTHLCSTLETLICLQHIDRAFRPKLLRRTIASFLILLISIELILTIGTPVHAAPSGFLTVRGTSIVNGNGDIVLLRGVNYGGYEHNPNDPPLLHTEASYRLFSSMGFNVVRLPISWANLEPTPGILDWVYVLQMVNRDVIWAKNHNLYVILDMQQDFWSGRFNGDGAPDWAVRQYPSTELGLRAAVSNFWINASLQNHLTRVWQRLAQVYANETTIAGYDILNEPWVYTGAVRNVNSTYVYGFYAKVMNAIRKVDSYHIFFLEPSNVETPGSMAPLKGKIVWSPHFYALSFFAKYYPQNFTLLEADIRAKYDLYVNKYQSPMLIGEFGAFMKDESYKQWLRDALGLFSKLQISWTWCAYDDAIAQEQRTIQSLAILRP
jgi:endoglycosylceramidase